MVESNPLLYKPGEHPDHCVVIKYVPYVGDSKRAMDEYTSEILMGGRNTIVIHNTCEDSLLASSLILDLIILTEICQRIQFRVDGQQEEFEGLVELQYYTCISYWCFYRYLVSCYQLKHHFSTIPQAHGASRPSLGDHEQIMLLQHIFALCSLPPIFSKSFLLTTLT